jgi:signal recognition particle subunit SRP68
VRPERVRGFLLSEQQVDTSLGRATDNSAKIALLETLLMDCKDAIAAVKDEMKTEVVRKQMCHRKVKATLVQTWTGP